MTVDAAHIDFTRLWPALLAGFKAIDPQVWAWAAIALLIVHIVAMIVIQRFGWKMRTAVAEASSAGAQDIPMDFFSAGQIAKWKIYGFIVFAPRHNGTTRGQYAWIRVARFTFLLLMAGFIAAMALAIRAQS